MNETIDFHRFGEEFWNIADVLRADIVKVTEYLEEFSYFLFLKLLDDRERQEEKLIKLDGKVFIPLIPEKYRFYNWAENPERWAKNHDFRTSIEFLNQMFLDLSRVDDEVDSKERIVKDRNLIRKIFRNHIIRLRYDRTITELTRKLTGLNLRSASYDVIGRAFEFLVNKLGEQGQYGQYFTPRHIVDFMVKMIDPKIGETIYDPAAGTGGFLVWAYEHIAQNIEREVIDAAEQEIKIRELKHNLFGTEKAPDVFKLGVMNLVLHGDGSANLIEGDSLSAPAQDANRNRYDVILTNPPFGPLPYDPSGVFTYSARLFEALFLQHLMSSIKRGGRAATVMKEGLLFSSSPRALYNIRKRLVDEYNLIAVVSMPSGVFMPYTGSKTSILLFERPKDKDSPKTNLVWFYKIDNDGFDLGATRRPIPENDLPGALEKFNNREESEKSWLVDVEEIRKNDYNLTANRYCSFEVKEVEYEKPEVLITQLLDLENEIQTGLMELLSIINK